MIATYRAKRLVERNVMVYKHTWLILFSGFFEPVFYLFSIGVGIGKLVGTIEGVPYRTFVAPALMASSAMNGAIFESTMNIFHKLKYAKIYDAVLATPVQVGDVALGEISWCLIRGSLYGAAFLAVMAADGLIESPWALAALPAAVLIGFAFASCGMAATSYARTWADFEIIQLVLVPLFLFSATFFPLSAYTRPVQLVVECTPLYHGVALLRALTLGHVDAGLFSHVAYLVAMGAIGLAITARRLERLLLP
jgi:lipooligosaccharide transport system permease protein